MELNPSGFQRRRDARRKNSRMRGYGGLHNKTRAVLAPFVDSGAAVCVRCGEAILPDEPWDLGHDDYDRTQYSGPEHASCNRAAPNRLRTSRAW